ncbi:hypothetical protein [Marilutibacter alkalisoli]|uniref:hypothetical protein n=1 Tax=Marilutibacter alkalisoli TaxID=2591633 RepID=UPI0014200050|nr:hypothetical protein [Lysobacter alkalisoli]
MPLTLGLTGMDPDTESALTAAFNAANARLGKPWHLVSETEAAYVIVDMDSMYGPMSWLRLHAARKQVTGLTTAARTQTDFRLERPFDVDGVSALLVELAANAGVTLGTAPGTSTGPETGTLTAAATPASPAPPSPAPPSPAPPSPAPPSPAPPSPAPPSPAPRSPAPTPQPMAAPEPIHVPAPVVAEAAAVANPPRPSLATATVAPPPAAPLRQPSNGTAATASPWLRRRPPAPLPTGWPRAGWPAASGWNVAASAS